MTTPPNSITPGTGTWIWTNPFGSFSSSSYSIGSALEYDTYRFQADVTGSYTISAGGSTLDSTLRVYNSGGASIGMFNMQGPGGTESAGFSFTAGNWYYAVVSGGATGSTGSYSLGITGPAPVVTTISTPALSYSGSFTGAAISPAGDIDWYKLVAPTGTTSLSFSTSAVGAGLDTTLQFLDASGNLLLGVNNAGAGLGDSASVTITAGSTYYVGVTSLGSGSYNLNADFNPDQTPPVLSIASLSADKSEGNDQTTPFTFTVTRTGDTSASSSVEWTIGTSQSPAADNSDFSGPTSGTLVWAPGDSSSKTITLNVAGDTTYEGGGLAEHFTVNLSGATGATIGTATASGNIQNDDPALTMTSDGGGDTATRTVDENSTAVTTVTASDANGGILTYSISGGDDQAKFAIDGSTGALSFIDAPDFEAPGSAAGSNSYVVQVRVVDDGSPSLADTQTITVNVADANDMAPVITTPATLSMAENATFVATLDSTDVDTVGTNPATFTVVGGPDAAKFTVIDGDLGFTAAPDFDNPTDWDQDNSYVVQVRATDGVNVADRTITVDVADVNDMAPVITTPTTLSIAENAAFVVALGSTDVDTVGTNPATFSIIGGADAAKFTVVDGELSFVAAPDFEDPTDSDLDNGYVVQVRASDGVNVANRTITIDVGDVNDAAPVIATPATLSMAENAAFVVALEATDVDTVGTNPATFSIVGGPDAAKFTVVDGDLSFIAAPDYENPADADLDNGYVVQVRASDGANVANRTITINVTDAIDVFNGGAGNDTLCGGPNDDALYGEAGDDVLIGENGADTLAGGTGNDTYLVNTLGTTIVEAAGEGNDTATVFVNGYTIGASVETAYLGAGVSAVTGNDTGMSVFARAGIATTINGGTGNDQLHGADQADTLNGGAGNDHLRGRAGTDTLYGGGGDDTLVGEQGADALVGGTGNDTYLVNTLGTTIAEAVNEGNDTAIVFVNDYRIGANVETAYLGAGVSFVTGNHTGMSIHARNGFGVGMITGGAGNDQLYGADQADTLYGGAGNDTLRGRAGNDTLIGASGEDVFAFSRGDGNDLVYASQSTGADTISFDSGVAHDQLWFSRSSNDVVVAVIGQNQTVTVAEWYTSSNNQVGQLMAGDGYSVTAFGVEQLVLAMASFTPPIGETTLPTVLATNLAPVFAAYWDIA